MGCKSLPYVEELLPLISLLEKDPIRLKELHQGLKSVMIHHGLKGLHISLLLRQAVLPGGLIHQLHCKTSQSAMPVILPCSAMW